MILTKECHPFESKLDNNSGSNAMMTRITTMTAAMATMTTMTTMTTMAMIVSEPGTLGLFPASCGKTCPGSIYDPHTREILSGQMDKSNDDVHGEILF